MDKSVFGLLGAVGALAVAGPAHAAVGAAANLDNIMQADSYADLLKPIPNAVALRAELAERRQAEAVEPQVLTVQYYYHHHHHHHHHAYYRRRYYHHHHHHHHHGIGVFIR